jgi:F0F1-type ATP synthase membrane subunit b/b'
MAEIEYKGIKVGGSKLLIIIPLIGTIMGGLWGGFELFNRYQQMETKINKYVTPDLSGFDKRIAIIEGKLVEIQESVITARDYTRDIKIDLKNDLDYVTSLTEDSNKETKKLDRELRADINQEVKDIKAQMKTIQSEIEESLEKTEKKINDRVEKALENPLAGMATSK